MKLAFDPTDPLTLAIAPPANETSEERRVRQEKEEHALQVSRRIDAELKAERIAMKKMRKAVRVLVLGQSLSGKSTTIKNFQMTYAQKSWVEERASWKAVIFLNLARSVNGIVDILSEELEIAQGILPNSDETAWHGSTSGLTENHKSLTLKLAPLRQIERDLQSLLGSGSSEPEDLHRKLTEGRTTLQEFALRSTSGWKSVLEQIRNPSEGKGESLHRVASQVIAGCKDDIGYLWNDAVVQQILRKRNIRIEDAPGFFLHDLDRIANLDYVPSDEDVVRARLRTTGVQEYRFTLDRGTASSLDWLMYDVAGIRTSRAAWIPYFKDITAIIFLAPLSAFNENLAEDPRINRLDDTFSLWNTICSSKLLSDVQIILFMNKIDILQRKLDSGILVKDFISDFQEQSNDFATVTTWFRRIFGKIHRKGSPPTRKLIAHFTSVVDTKSTAQTLAAVQAVILTNDIVEAGLL
ncbi:Guanine nucleotide-binding protein alpha-4 subunit [Hypsizygus marmoreus]|uniref:Guanine nucleotide-binding protein alpha-4 subunit n=1 Tax=Hypsizygus marmoreus TaxID=39966 RepID=A0A369JR87_HYPMA|nr:Guanine nucleotide-binding protein alpha-4 subunit [Hypsizygus marmoreus]